MQQKHVQIGPQDCAEIDFRSSQPEVLRRDIISGRFIKFRAKFYEYD